MLHECECVKTTKKKKERNPMGLRNISPIVWWILHSLIKVDATGMGVGVGVEFGQEKNDREDMNEEPRNLLHFQDDFFGSHLEDREDLFRKIFK